LITTMLGSVVVVWLLMMPVPPLNFSRYLFNDDHSRPGERHSLRAAMPSSEKRRTSNDREEQYCLRGHSCGTAVMRYGVLHITAQRAHARAVAKILCGKSPLS
jgi:hypothetical protein